LVHSDDLTVEVIFFGEGDSSGTVVVNKEATASSNEEVKAKL
jgi:pyruvate dehydrogenase phosphatase